MIISCFSDEIAPSLSVQLKVLEELKMSHLEIRTVDDINVMNMSDSRLNRIRMECADRGFVITCVSSPIGKSDLDESLASVENQVERASEIAEIFRCRFIRIFSFYQKETEPRIAFGLAAEKLSRMAETARRFGKVLVMEGGHSTVGAGAKVALRLFEAVNSPNLRCAFDPGALVVEGEIPFTNCYPLLSPYIEYMHVKDAKIGGSNRLVAGAGDGQIEEILKALAPREDFIASLEPHLAYAGAQRGFSGEQPFRDAHKALVSILEKNQIAYR